MANSRVNSSPIAQLALKITARDRFIVHGLG